MQYNGWVILIAAIYIGIPLLYTKKGIKHSVVLAYIIGVFIFSDISYNFLGTEGRLSAFVYSAQLFTMAISGKDLLEMTKALSSDVYIPAMICVWSVYIIYPILTASIVLTYIKKGLDRTALRAKFFKKIFVFTEKNPYSELLAADICKNDSKAIVVFADTNSTKDTPHTFCISFPATKIFSLINKTNKIHICFNDTNDDVLLDKLVQLLEMPRKTILDISIFSDSKIVEEVVDSLKVSAENARIRVINTKAIMMRNILWNYPLFANAESKTELNVTVVGTGDFGGYFASNVLWCGQLPGCRLKLNLVDREDDSDILRRVSENISDKYFDIETFNYNIDTNDFFKGIKTNRIIDSDYIMVSMGTDDTNIKIARELRLLFGRMNKNPFIITVIENQSKFTIMQEVLNKEHIAAIGGVENIYSIDNIFYDEYLNRAFEVYKIVEKNYGHDATLDDFYMQKQIDIYSSYANAVHCKYKVHYLTDGNLDADYDEISKKAIEKNRELSSCEHDRWVAFEVLKGYVGVDEKELEEFLQTNSKKGKIHKNEELKIHACITDLDGVDRLDEIIEKNFEKKINLKEIDELIAAKTADLWFLGR